MVAVNTLLLALNLLRLKSLPSILYMSLTPSGRFWLVRWRMTATKMMNRVGAMMHCDSGRISLDSGSSRLARMRVSTLPIVDRREIPL